MIQINSRLSNRGVESIAGRQRSEAGPADFRDMRCDARDDCRTLTRHVPPFRIFWAAPAGSPSVFKQLPVHPDGAIARTDSIAARLELSAREGCAKQQDQRRVINPQQQQGQ